MSGREQLSEDEQYARLFDHILGHQATEIAAIGLRSGLFAAIGERPGSTDLELASATGLDTRYVSVWARSAFAHGFCDRTEEGGYALAAHMDRLLLDPTAPTYMGGRFRMESAIDEDYRRFPELLRTGATWPRSDHDPEMLDALADGSLGDGLMITDHVIPQLPTVLERLRAGGRILEIGAGAGVHTVHYATTYPACAVVALEYDGPSVALARTRVESSEVAARVEIRHADANNLDDREMFDLVTLNVVLHETGGQVEYHNVLRRAHDALRAGGGIVVSELPYPDNIDSYRTNRIHRRLAGLQLHEAVVGCGAITQRQLHQLMRATGFSDIRVADQPRSSRHVLIGTKSTS